VTGNNLVLHKALIDIMRFTCIWWLARSHYIIYIRGRMALKLRPMQLP